MAHDLPIYEIEQDLCRAFRAERRLILQAPTGSGKSTQVPQMLVDNGIAGEGRIVVLQPRRLAARMLAARVAQERGVRLGDEVGYQVRFNDRTSARTRIEFVTEGILLRRLLGDRALRGVGTVILDEFHERHLDGDVALGYALHLQRTARPDLRIIVMSATLDSDALARHLGPCVTLVGKGRTYPVATEYLPRPFDDRKTPVWTAAAQEFDRLARLHADGHVLIFMPGAYEIHKTIQAVRSMPAAGGCAVMPLHGELAESDQDRAVGPSDRRKVVVATNVAETSLTIDGVRLVIDSGLARVARFDPNRGINTLLTEKITRDSADQRAGRAGRTGPGVCLRLWTEAEHGQRAPHIVPEIRRLDLSEVILSLKAAAPGAAREGDPLADVRAFPWLDAPEEKSLLRSFRLLADLSALDAHTGAITPTGERMVSFPLHPRFSRMLLAAGDLGCLGTAALIAAMTQERGLFVRRPDEVARENRNLHIEQEGDSDFFPLIQAWDLARKRGYDADECRRLGIHGLTARRVEQVFEAVLRVARDQGLSASPEERSDAIRQCILLGFSDQLARRVSAGANRYELVHGRRGTLAKDSMVRKSDLLVASEIREVEVGRKDVEVLLSLCTVIEPQWLDQFYPEDFGRSRDVVFDETQKRVVAREHRMFRDLVVETRVTAPTEEETAAALAEEVLAGRITLKNWGHEVDQWIERVNLVARACPERGIGAIDAEARPLLVREICRGVNSVKELRDAPVLPALKQWLSGAQRAEVDRLAPERLDLPNGRHPKVVYGGESPYIQARIQELYGVTGRLAIAGGRVTVVVHILAPSHRPIQITDDLAGFWRDVYPRAKKELQRKYPKHEWR